jgi:hypothetical protein
MWSCETVNEVRVVAQPQKDVNGRYSFVNR